MIYFSSALQNGIKYVNDFLNERGKPMTYKSIEEKFPKALTWIQYYGKSTAISKANVCAVEKENVYEIVECKPKIVKYTMHLRTKQMVKFM